MKALLILALTFFAGTATADDVANHESIQGFLAGTYLVVGREMESGTTYSGKVVIAAAEDHLAVTREINGETIKAIGRIEHALGPDAANVLRVRYTRGGEKFEITYLWRTDLDNYARLSGYVYHPGEKTQNPGVEALFIDHTNR